MAAIVGPGISSRVQQTSSGIAGLVWHFEGPFFQEITRRLVYSAPFIAPLAFAGLGLQALTGLVGFVSIAPLFEEAAVPLAERLIFGAPVFAPLLFVDLAVLAAAGLWDLQVKQRTADLVEA